MTRPNRLRPPSLRSRRLSRGIASVLTVLLMGLGMSAAVFGVAMHLRGTQEQAMTVNAVTRAQMKAWTGAEAVRQYLGALGASQRAALLASATSGTRTTLVFGDLGGISAVVLPESTASELHVAVTGVSASDTRAQASATVLAVFAMGSGGESSGPPVVLNFNRNLKLGGSITVLKDAGSTTSFEVNVNGDVSTNGNAITGVESIRSTGTINIDSGSSYGSLHANCDVVISGSVTAATVQARRHVCASGSAAVSGVASANGSITSAAGFSANGTLQARASATDVQTCQASGVLASSSSTVASTCASPAESGVDLSAGGAGAGTVRSLGNVRVHSGRIGSLAASGNLQVLSSAAVDSGTVGGAVVRPNWNAAVRVGIVQPTTPSIPEVQPVSIPGSRFDAREHESSAHYAFRVDAQGFRRVTVSNIAGVPSATYFLGNYGGNSRDYLCTALAAGSTPASPTCTVPALASSWTLCRGFSEWNNCISYNAVTRTWRVEGNSLAPGVVWFEGNLEASSGTYYNTFIATGNIVTSGSHRNSAPNYVGYNGSSVGELRGTCSNAWFPSLVPTNLCDTARQAYVPGHALANFAYMAGSFSTGSPPMFEGGNVSLGASTVANGSVLAGNQFQSGGSTTVRGYASAFGQGVATLNTMGGSTTFDLRALPSHFVPAPALGATGAVSLRYARYR